MTTAPTQSDYFHAWTDLRGRLRRGTETLRTLRAAHRVTQPNSGEPATTVLSWKIEALDDAYTVYQNLNDDAVNTGDYQHAWLTFADRLNHILTVGSTPNHLTNGYLLGVKVAQGYQRGYTPAIDITPETPPTLPATT